MQDCQTAHQENNERRQRSDTEVPRKSRSAAEEPSVLHLLLAGCWLILGAALLALVRAVRFIRFPLGERRCTRMVWRCDGTL
jgi:uncharacterized membrane protein YccF (DUF307 family)